MTTTSQRPRIYLAGPDVFFPDRERIFAELVAHCDRLGLVGLVPADGGLSEGFVGTDEEVAQRIYEGNIALIQSADGVATNLVNFRGTEPDCGSVFELGFAVALKKPVVAYGVPPGTYAERVAGVIPCAKADCGTVREVGSDVMVEGRGQRVNLMLSRSTPIVSSAEAALAMLAELLNA